MWLFLTVLSVICLVWLHTVVRRLTREQNETLFTRFEHPTAASVTAPAPAIAGAGAAEPA
jgi:hypothetical protein